MKGSELTLVFFTLLMQAAAGFLLTFGIINGYTGWKNEIALFKNINEKLLFLVCALFAAGFIVSFFHLGNVKNAYYALNNIATSWLSREILLVILFGGFTLLFTLLYSKNLLPAQVQQIVLFAAMLAGMVLVFAMSKVYMLEVVPVWNSPVTPIGFYLSSFILGIILFISASLYLMNKNKIEYTANPVIAGIVKALILILLLLVFLELIMWIVKIYSLAAGERAAHESLDIILNGNFIPVIIKVLTQAAAIYFLITAYRNANAGNHYYADLNWSMYLIIAALIAGRYIFYISFNRTGI